MVEIVCDDGTVGIGNAALSPHATKTTIDTYLKPLLIGTDPLDNEYIWQSMYRRTLPFGRMGRSEEIAEAVVWLCSDVASFVSGESMLVDGASVCR